MKTLILYASKHGCAKKAAEKIAEALGNDTDVNNVRNISRIDIDDYDKVIIGGSIHAGRIQGQIKSFTRKNMNQLLEKTLGLFICHMEADKDKAMKELSDNFPEPLMKHATAKGLFGGEFDFDKMNFLEKFIIKKIANVNESVSSINEDNIENFISVMKD
ncbi:MAG: flavodoxin domain-containing protein [Candidatus Marinimicrobia bacterium]|nr:flavodoxin domain-containing protein [Candidatus Neomarinimicrobiota bacterium]